MKLCQILALTVAATPALLLNAQTPRPELGLTPCGFFVIGMTEAEASQRAGDWGCETTRLFGFSLVHRKGVGQKAIGSLFFDGGRIVAVTRPLLLGKSTTSGQAFGVVIRSLTNLGCGAVTATLKDVGGASTEFATKQIEFACKDHLIIVSIRIRSDAEADHYEDVSVEEMVK